MKSVDTNYNFFKNTLHFLCLFTSLNIYILNVKASDINNETQISEEEFNSVFKGNSNMFEEKDIDSHLRQFFGLNPIEETNKINYPDLSITNDSKNLRELYDAKLKEMSTIENRDGEEIESFFKEKL